MLTIVARPFWSAFALKSVVCGIQEQCCQSSRNHPLYKLTCGTFPWLPFIHSFDCNTHYDTQGGRQTEWAAKELYACVCV